MDNYGKRLHTFKDWPADHPVTPGALASAGQYYTGPGDETTCYVCQKRMKDWEAGDDPYDEHKRLFPSCRLNQLPREAAAQTKDLPDLTATDHAPQPESDLEQGVQRLSVAGKALTDWNIKTLYDSYDDRWPLKGDLWKQNLALAGFQYTGEGDRVKCHHCGVELSHWEPEDIPVYEHKRIAPECMFIKRLITELKDNPPMTRLPKVDVPPTYIKDLPGQTGGPSQETVPLPTVVNPEAKCILCNQRLRQVLFEPCSHFVVCEICSRELTHCPVCGCLIVKKTKYNRDPT